MAPGPHTATAVGPLTNTAMASLRVDASLAGYRELLRRRFFDREIAEGKTGNEAMRCLKRRIAAHVWRRMLADEQRRHRHPNQPPVAA